MLTYLFWYWWGMSWIWWIVWIFFLIWIFATPWGYRGRRDTPLDILKRRYANGEITKEEYMELKAELER